MKIERPLRAITIALLCAMIVGAPSASLADGECAAAMRVYRESPWLLDNLPQSASPYRTDSTLLALPSEYGGCTKLVYQSYVGDDWQVFIADGDGGNLTQLTWGSENNSPTLSPDGDEIVFNSDRSGDEVLWAMDIDGSNPRQLTDAVDGDKLPAFSPDGSRIAFQSYRDDEEPEIYILELANGALTRLTENDDYDGQPDWSPDGEHIVFISGRGGGKNVWVMEHDGDNPQQLTTMPYCGGPVWSPDGEQITFAGDADNTIYTDVWVMNSDGSDQQLVYGPTEPYHDAWPSAWSPDGRYIMYEEAYWNPSLVSSSLDVVDPDNTSDRQTVIGNGSHMSPDWKAYDETAPASSVNPLASVSDRSVLVSWSGSDSCSDEIEYNVQYRLGDDGTWTDWQITPGSDWTVETHATFQFSQSATAYFRCRARDDWYNVEAWPSGDGDTFTTYEAPAEATGIAGYVYDVRGQPVPGATVSTGGEVPVSATTGDNGRFVVSLEDGFDQRLTAQAIGLHDEPMPPLFCGLDSQLRAHMATNTNLIVNGGFESGQAAWYASGNVAFEASDVAYGGRIARLGYEPLTGHLAATDGGETIEIRQEIAIPADMRWPTLSLLCTLGDGDGESAGQVTLHVDNGAAETELVCHRLGADWHTDNEWGTYPVWQHLWADLSPWAGEAVTLHIRYSPDWTYKSVLLDQVSVSSWRSPYIDSVTPRSVMPDTETTVTIRGANLELAQERAAPLVDLGGIALTVLQSSDEELVVQVPSTIPVGIHALTVTNAEGYVGVRSSAVTVGGYVTLPMILRQ